MAFKNPIFSLSGFTVVLNKNLLVSLFSFGNYNSMSVFFAHEDGIPDFRCWRGSRVGKSGFLMVIYACHPLSFLHVYLKIFLPVDGFKKEGAKHHACIVIRASGRN